MKYFSENCRSSKLVLKSCDIFTQTQFLDIDSQLHFQSVSENYHHDCII